MRHNKKMIAKYDRRQRDYDDTARRLGPARIAGYRRPGSRKLKRAGG